MIMNKDLKRKNTSSDETKNMRRLLKRTTAGTLTFCLRNTFVSLGHYIYCNMSKTFLINRASTAVIISKSKQVHMYHIYMKVNVISSLFPRVRGMGFNMACHKM